MRRLRKVISSHILHYILYIIFKEGRGPWKEAERFLFSSLRAMGTL